MTLTDGSRATTPKEQILRMYDVNLLGIAASYDLREKEERARSTEDLSLLFFRTVRAFAPKLFIEAGAKDASGSRRGRRYLKDARIVAFEANPYTYARFRERNEQKMPEVEYVHSALSDKPGKITFNVRKTSDGTPRADGQGSLTKRKDYAEGYEEIEVEATTLDAFFGNSGTAQCVAWVDVEGALESVLKGGAQLIEERCLAMFVEVEDREVWEGSWQMSQVADYLYDRGLIPIARDFQSRYQYNVLFVRDSMLSAAQFRALLSDYRSSAATGLLERARAGAGEPASRIGHLLEDVGVTRALKHLGERGATVAERVAKAVDVRKK